MNDREILSIFIKEVIAENNGIYNWSWSPHWDDYEHHNEIENNLDLWREKILKNDWMINSPFWKVFEIGMYYMSTDGKVKYMEDATILVDKEKSIKEFEKGYKDRFDTPVYIEWVEILGTDGGHYENIVEATGPIKLFIDKFKAPIDEDHPFSYFQELADSIVI